MKSWLPVICLALLAPAGAGLAQTPTLPRQGGGTLEIAPQPQPNLQQNVPQAQPTPRFEPSQSVLIIPQASREFIGEWGGKLQVRNVAGNINPPPTTIVSLLFGETDGAVYMRTTAFASPNSNILQTSAEVVNPRRVKLELKGLEIQYQPPVRHFETLTLALVGHDQMDCIKNVDLYVPGNPNPVASVHYHGTLHLLSEQERHELEREVVESGAVPQRTIEERRRFDR